MSVVSLKSREFRKERESGWREMEELITIARTMGMRALSNDDLLRLPLLYRAVLSSLSVARSIALDRALVAYLDNLALRAFLVIYARPISIGQSMREFLMGSLPRAVRGMRWQVAIALFALLLGIASGFALVNHDEGWFPVIVPAGMAQGRGPSSTRQELLRVLSAQPQASAALLTMANFLFSNNTLVSLLIFGMGVLAGVPTLLLTFGNGLGLGAFLALHYHRGLLGEFAGWVSIHGVSELGAIVLFAAAGLKLGEAVLSPGAYTRTDALTLNGPAAGEVAVGGVLMLLVAAVLEGVFRQVIGNTNARLTVAVASLVLWTAYYAGVGRSAAK
ncbi:MAG TPA: stage II sporulation protein M [Bryobacteraceae bacterium]|nr:stage II sporulation protein M [Bryobacteraceae bacterium]